MSFVKRKEGYRNSLNVLPSSVSIYNFIEMGFFFFLAWVYENFLGLGSNQGKIQSSVFYVKWLSYYNQSRLNLELFFFYSLFKSSRTFRLHLSRALNLQTWQTVCFYPRGRLMGL